jgi:chromosome segregation protein
LHITELRLAGFKSFVDPVKAPVEPGLTGVVGPNGCGKSNLLEAVRWVMGAASAKSMRAADMDDVIFAGSAGRPAREHADVTLVLHDALGRAPAPLNKEPILEVTRRIRRGLGSTYRINGKEVRAKDVQLLFADAATGANSPALVRQGQISELIASKPENRRRILEDAAGIAGLHSRRHEADLKLRAAEQNLARLDEVAAEIDGQVNALKKQARQAERYRGLAQTLRETEALLLHRRWMEAREREAEAQGFGRDAERAVAGAAADASAAERTADEAREKLTPLREEEAIASAVLRRLEGVRVGLERDLADAEAAIARADADLQRARSEAERLEALRADAETALKRLEAELSDLSPSEGKEAQAALERAQAAEAEAARARNEAETKLETLAADAAARRARMQALKQSADAARARLARAEQRKGELDAQTKTLAADEFAPPIDIARQKADAARSASAEARTALNQSEAALKAAEKADEAAWTPYRAAESAQRQLEAEMRGLEKLAPPDAGKFPPALAQIEVEAGYERALAAALGEDIDASVQSEAPLHWSGAKTPAAKLLPPQAQALARFVKAPPQLAARLALVGVVDAREGPALAKDLEPGARLVSREGDLWRWDGFVRRADAPQPAAAKLEHKNRLAAARTELKNAEAKHADAKQKWERAKTERQTLEAKARELRAAAPKRVAEETAAVQELERLNAEAVRRDERRGELAAQLEALGVEITEARAVLRGADGAPGDAPIDDDALAAARSSAEAARLAAAQAAAAAQSLLRDRDQRAARRATLELDAAQWRARIDSAVKRLTALGHEIDDIKQRRDAAEAAPRKAGAALDELMDQAQAAEARRAEAGDAVALAETAAREAAETARAREQAHASARERRAGAEANASAAKARLDDIAAHAHEQTGKAPEDLAALAGALLSSALGQAAISEIERRFDRLKSERDAAGPVNLRAEEELQEAQTRLDTLHKEKEDVMQAVAKLRRAITTLNNEGRARLMRAFEQVDAHFAQLFAALFEGGQAALKLTESEDPLEAGLEIFAQPPGKRLTNLSLLSGGEQALTATALIFAVFLANPAPLCVLDEVDAPLDDANVDRFCRLLEEMKRLTTTRFIVITHNPVTMSRMDRLYGVTMQEQGVSQLVSVDLTRAQAMAATA